MVRCLGCASISTSLASGLAWVEERADSWLIKGRARFLDENLIGGLIVDAYPTSDGRSNSVL